MIVCDVRSLGAIYRYLAYLEPYQAENILFLISNSVDCSMISMHYKSVESGVYANDHYLLSKPLKLIALFKSLRKITSGLKVQLLTTYPDSVFFCFLARALRLEQHNDVIAFDDGTLNIGIPKIRRNLLIKVILWAIGGRCCADPSYLYYKGNYKAIATSFNALLPDSITTKNLVLDISKKLSNSYLQNTKPVFLKELNFADAVLVLSHHGVESKRLSINDYQQRFSELIKKVRLRHKSKIFYLSKHPAESSINDQFYKNCGLKLDFSRYPSEVLLRTGCFSVICQPYNSVMCFLNSADPDCNVKFIFSYEVPGSPYIEQRKMITSEVVSKFGLEHIEI